MSRKHLKRAPHVPRTWRWDDGLWWWYEENGGITVITQHMGTAVPAMKISWRAIRAALKRKDRKLVTVRAARPSGRKP